MTTEPSAYSRAYTQGRQMPSDQSKNEFDLEAAVAQFIVDFSWADIEAASKPAVKALLKDQLALQVGAVQLPWSREARRFLSKPRPGTSTVVAESVLMDAADAAYINATYGHGFEYDDVASNGHPGCCVVPTALAVGEEVGATLGQVVEAMVAGYEVYVRIGRLAAPDLVNAGWHAHAVLANFGAAAVAAKLQRLDANKVLHAMAIALSHASGTTEYTKSGGSIKRVHAGIAVRNGIEAVRLASVGITGPKRYLTGQKGFFRNFIRRPVVDSDAAEAFQNRRLQRIKDIWLKAYCCCGAHHAYIDAMKDLRERVDEIESVDAVIQAMTRTLGDNPHAQRYGTSNIEELQFSLALQMALAALGKGNGYATHRAFLDGKFQLGEDSDVVEFARRIRLIHSPDLDTRFPFNFVGEVVVHYKDGTTQNIFMDGAKGMPNNPFTDKEHRIKFDELTHEVMGVQRADNLFELVERLDPEMPIVELSRLLQCG
jgi:2-methylcitrate dehydratase PrpD